MLRRSGRECSRACWSAVSQEPTFSFRTTSPGVVTLAISPFLVPFPSSHERKRTAATNGKGGTSEGEKVPLSNFHSPLVFRTFIKVTSSGATLHKEKGGGKSCPSDRPATQKKPSSCFPPSTRLERAPLPPLPPLPPTSNKWPRAGLTKRGGGEKATSRDGRSDIPSPPFSFLFVPDYLPHKRAQRPELNLSRLRKETWATVGRVRGGLPHMHRTREGGMGEDK